MVVFSAEMRTAVASRSENLHSHIACTILKAFAVHTNTVGLDAGRALRRKLKTTGWLGRVDWLSACMRPKSSLLPFSTAVLNCGISHKAMICSSL